MKKTKLMAGLMFAGFTAMAGTASAEITGPTVIDFENLAVDSVGGKPNLNGVSTSGMYTEDGMRIGIVNDPLDTISHLHRETATVTGIQLQYHSDSSGIYMRASDDSAFSLESMDFHSQYDESHNPHAQIGGDGGVNDVWEIFGFSDARNPAMLTANADAYGVATDPDTGFPTNPAVAYATVANGFDGVLNVLALDAHFGNISSFWIHYKGFPHSPNAYIQYDPLTGEPLPGSSAYSFALEIDNVHLNHPVAAVPVPAAAWLFGTGLLGMLSLGRKKTIFSA